MTKVWLFGLASIVLGLANQLFIQCVPDEHKQTMLAASVLLYVVGFALLAVGAWTNRRLIFARLPRIQVHWPDEAAQGVSPPAAESRSVDGPNQTIKWAVDHINSALGQPGSLESKGWRELRQAARLGQVTIWGRPNASTYKPKEPIGVDHWRDYGFDYIKCQFGDDPETCGSQPDDPRRNLPGDRYIDLRVNDVEVRRMWPQASTAFASGSDRRSLLAGARTFTAMAVKAGGGDDAFRKELESSEIFLKLHPHLSERFLRMVRPGARVAVVSSGSGSTMADLAIGFVKEIDRLEAEWGLR
jgi:hypothetical protein